VSHDTSAPSTSQLSGASDAPVARRSVARVACGTLQLLWSPWAPPVLFDARSAALLDALDGRPLTTVTGRLAEVEKPAAGDVEAELRPVVHQLERHGLLTSSPAWAHWSPAALNRAVTPCDRQTWRLDDADLVDLEVGRRRITVATADPHLATALRAQQTFPQLPAATDLSTAALELVVTPSERPRGVHRLFGRAGRTYHRSTDLAAVVGSFTAHLAALAWMERRSDLVWLDACALVVPGGVALLPGRVRDDWARLGRRLATYGVTGVETVQVALDPATAEVVLPPAPDPEVVAIERAWARLTGVEPGGVRVDRPAGGVEAARRGTGPGDDDGGRLPVVRIDHLVDDAELQDHVVAGHRSDRLDPAVGAQRMAVLAHHGALDGSTEPPDVDRATAVLHTVVHAATRAGVRHRLHHRIAPLLASFAPAAP
jgi:hypothetical protein